MGLIDPSGIRDTSLGYGFAPRTISAGAPDDVVAVAARAPHDVVTVAGRAPHDVVAAVGAAARRAPDDVVAVIAERLDRAPDGLPVPRVRVRDHDAARDAVVPPEE